MSWNQITKVLMLSMAVALAQIITIVHHPMRQNHFIQGRELSLITKLQPCPLRKIKHEKLINIVTFRKTIVSCIICFVMWEFVYCGLASLRYSLWQITTLLSKQSLIPAKHVHSLPGGQLKQKTTYLSCLERCCSKMNLS